jgi:hypothetical protein
MAAGGSSLLFSLGTLKERYELEKRQFDVKFFWSLASLSAPLTASRLLTLHLYGVDREYFATPFFDVILVEVAQVWQCCTGNAKVLSYDALRLG